MAMFQLCVESPSSGVSWGLDDRRHVVKTSLSTRWWHPCHQWSATRPDSSPLDSSPVTGTEFFLWGLPLPREPLL